MSQIRDLEPKLMWELFDEITRVPRPSKREEKIVAYLVDFAVKNNLAYRHDAIGNVVICRPAAKGYEHLPVVVLQSHVDMVCEKNSGVEHDFDNDPIDAYVDNGWVKARGTTLGADCGIGMAAAMAVLTDPAIECGAVEALFTVDEETGLTGAFNLEEGMISGKYLINLDSEDEGEIFIGCAGGVDTLASYALQCVDADTTQSYYRIEVSGLKGGHSGDDIDKGRANSIKLLANLLYDLQSKYDISLHKIEGGNLRNAIPREAYAVIGVDSAKCDELESAIAQYTSEVKGVYAVTEDSLSIVCEPCEMPEKLLECTLQTSLLRALIGLPNGVLAMSQTMPGLVETSSNLASVKFVDDTIVVTTSQRSSVERSKRDAAHSIEAVFVATGGDVLHSDGYPGWTPNPDSQLLELTKESYVELFGCEAKVRAIHAGLECGLFLQRYPSLEMVSFGPTLRGVHSPDERIEIESVAKFWKLLLHLLKRLK